jgi:hypothetical protein
MEDTVTRLDEYYKDMERVWSAIIIVGSIAIVGLLILISHLFQGR